jgi:hypothetical protein
MRQESEFLNEHVLRLNDYALLLNEQAAHVKQMAALMLEWSGGK